MTVEPPAAEGAGWESLAVVFLGIIAAFVVPYIIRRRQRQRPANRPVRERHAEHQARAEAQRTADRILVDLVETSREVSGRLDTKIRILNTLLRDAERAIARLEALQGQASDGTTAAGAETPPSSAPDADAPAGAGSAVETPLATSAATPGGDHGDAGDGAVTRDDSATTAPEASPPASSASARRRQAMLAEGRPPPEPAPTAGKDDGAAGDDEEDLLARLAAEPAVGDGEGGPETAKRAAVGGAGRPDVPPPGGPTGERVAALAAQGLDVPEIARQLGLSRQEVKLVLHLHAQGRG